MLDEICGLFDANVRRVEKLIALHGPPTRGRKTVHETDILRAALVLLHASMEDFLRSLLIWKIPMAGKELVDAYPLAGSDRKRAEKFMLGALVAHRGMSVDDLITKSIVEYLDRWSSFNDLGEVKKALVASGIPDANVENHVFGDLPTMIARRHNIVHKADRNDVVQGQGNHRTKSISVRQLDNYVTAVKNLKSFVVENVEH